MVAKKGGATLHASVAIIKLHIRDFGDEESFFGQSKSRIFDLWPRENTLKQPLPVELLLRQIRR